MHVFRWYKMVLIDSLWLMMNFREELLRLLLLSRKGIRYEFTAKYFWQNWDTRSVEYGVSSFVRVTWLGSTIRASISYVSIDSATMNCLNFLFTYDERPASVSFKGLTDFCCVVFVSVTKIAAKSSPAKNQRTSFQIPRIHYSVGLRNFCSVIKLHVSFFIIG